MEPLRRRIFSPLFLLGLGLEQLHRRAFAPFVLLVFGMEGFLDGASWAGAPSLGFSGEASEAAAGPCRQAGDGQARSSLGPEMPEISAVQVDGAIPFVWINRAMTQPK